jgi:hypothetical protein
MGCIEDSVTEHQCMPNTSGEAWPSMDLIVADQPIASPQLAYGTLTQTIGCNRLPLAMRADTTGRNCSFVET